MTLRVALISTPFVSVPPKGYGGTELVVAELAKALTAQGTDVVVYATGDSDLPEIEIRSYFPAPQWPPDHDIERVHTTWSLRDAARDPRGFDVVHVHSASAVEMARLSPYPVLCTLHHDYVPELSDLYRRTPEVRLVAISRSQARRETAAIAAVVHHGLDPARYQPMEDQGYLLFLGRYDRVKGVAQAIEVAARAKLPLVMAGEPHEREYYESEVRPLIDKHRVLEVGPVGGARKAALMARARALLFPIQWEEPFGLVMIEAMGCGTPVIGFDRGSVPEIIQDGVTGFIRDSEDELAEAVSHLDEIDRGRCRAEVEKRFSAQAMADSYLAVYDQVRRTSRSLNAIATRL